MQNKKAGFEIAYIIRRYKSSKSLRLKIYNTGKIVVTAPKRLPQFFIKKFVQSKSDWIREQLNLIETTSKVDIKKEKEDYKKYKEKARLLVNKKLKEFNQYYNFKYNSVFIRNQQTRWGSCSSRKNLNFNFKIVFLPEHLVNYLIVHELCHLAQMNHGREFWKLVSQTIPEYQENRSELHKFKINTD